jgi:hypothetical protein
VLGKDTWMLIFWSFLSKISFFFGVWLFYSSFFMEQSWGQDQVFFFFLWQNFSHLVTKKRTFWKQIPKARDTLRKEKLK